MENQFFVIIEDKNRKEFHDFTKHKFTDDSEKILKRYDCKYALGFHKALAKGIWNKIKKNDKIYITLKDEQFKLSGIISKKIKKEEFGGIFYPNAINKKQINYFLFFKKLEKENISYSELVRNYSEKTIYNEKGIHKVKKEFYLEKIKKKKSKQSVPKKLPFEKTIGKAKKNRRYIESYVRNKNVKPLKALYNDKCQITECNFTLEYVNEKDGRKVSYSEAHHYNPLKNEGNDDWNNMIILCPNHHAEFDFRIKFIDSDMITIINQDGKETDETIEFHKDHKFDKKNIENNLEKYNEV